MTLEALYHRYPGLESSIRSPSYNTTPTPIQSTFPMSWLASTGVQQGSTTPLFSLEPSDPLFPLTNAGSFNCQSRVSPLMSSSADSGGFSFQSRVSPLMMSSVNAGSVHAQPQMPPSLPLTNAGSFSFLSQIPSASAGSFNFQSQAAPSIPLLNAGASVFQTQIPTLMPSTTATNAGGFDFQPTTLPSVAASSANTEGFAFNFSSQSGPFVFLHNQPQAPPPASSVTTAPASSSSPGGKTFPRTHRPPLAWRNSSGSRTTFQPNRSGPFSKSLTSSPGSSDSSPSSMFQALSAPCGGSASPAKKAPVSSPVMSELSTPSPSFLATTLSPFKPIARGGKSAAAAVTTMGESNTGPDWAVSNRDGKMFIVKTSASNASQSPKPLAPLFSADHSRKATAPTLSGSSGRRTSVSAQKPAESGRQFSQRLRLNRPSAFAKVGRLGATGSGGTLQTRMPSVGGWASSSLPCPFTTVSAAVVTTSSAMSVSSETSWSAPLEGCKAGECAFWCGFVECLSILIK